MARVCGVTGLPLLCWIAWIDVAQLHQPARHVDDGVVQGVVTIFLGPTALLFVLAAVMARRGARAARVIAYCGALWPVVMTVACFVAFSLY